MRAGELKIRRKRPSMGFGYRVRSYVLHPYRLVVDHRTGRKTADVEAVLDGNIGLVSPMLAERDK